MIGYNELYEILRKEKYSESLQPLPKKFLNEFKEYVKESKTVPSRESNLFSDSIEKSRKQLENSLAIFRELILKRKKKILNLVFIATETGIMKRDYENMLSVEKQVFDSLVKTFEHGDAQIKKILNGQDQIKEDQNKLVLFNQDIEEFVTPEGSTIGPFKSGDLTNINSDIAKILVSSEKATFVDEN